MSEQRPPGFRVDPKTLAAAAARLDTAPRPVEHLGQTLARIAGESA